MEIEVAQNKLAKALNIVSKVAMGAKATLPILSTVLIRANKNKVSLTTTNLDMAVVDFIPVVKSKDGVVAVPARLLAEFVSNLPKDEVVKIAADGDGVKITAGKYSSTINGANAEDFPELPDIAEDEAVKFSMNISDFTTGVSEVIIASSGDTTRPVLTGVYFDTVDGDLNIVATDGYRLAKRCLVKKVKSEVKAIVPTSSLQDVLRSVTDSVEEIEILFDENQARFRLGEIEITSKLIDGVYPDYKQLIPETTEIEATMNNDELMRITKMAAIFARESSRAICCESTEDGLFKVSSIANEVGENISEIKADVTKNGEVKLDSRYLIDALNVLKEKKVKFCFSNNVNPIVIKNEKNNDYTHIIMPLKF